MKNEKIVKIVMIHREVPVVYNEGTKYETSETEFLVCYQGTVFNEEVIKEYNEKRISIVGDELENDGDYYYLSEMEDFGFNHE